MKKLKCDSCGVHWPVRATLGRPVGIYRMPVTTCGYNKLCPKCHRIVSGILQRFVEAIRAYGVDFVMELTKQLEDGRPRMVKPDGKPADGKGPGIVTPGGEPT